MESSFGTFRPPWYFLRAMGQNRFLTTVHETVRESARSGQILDAYRLADELIAADLSYAITRLQAVNTVLAASVVYGAPLFLDPEYAHSATNAAPRPADRELLRA